MDYIEKEQRVRQLLLAYRIFLLETRKINIDEIGIDLEFCNRYKNAINWLFNEYK